METDEIKQHLSTGDYVKIGKLVGISSNYAIKLLGRPKAKKHKAVVAAAEKVATLNMEIGL